VTVPVSAFAWQGRSHGLLRSVRRLGRCHRHQILHGIGEVPIERDQRAWRTAIWASRKSTLASSMVVTKVRRSMCGCGRIMRTRQLRLAGASAGGGMAVHAFAAAVEQDRPTDASPDSAVDDPPGS
jgi:hypothetical protein